MMRVPRRVISRTKLREFRQLARKMFLAHRLVLQRQIVVRWSGHYGSSVRRAEDGSKAAGAHRPIMHLHFVLECDPAPGRNNDMQPAAGFPAHHAFEVVSPAPPPTPVEGRLAEPGRARLEKAVTVDNQELGAKVIAPDHFVRIAHSAAGKCKRVSAQPITIEMSLVSLRSETVQRPRVSQEQNVGSLHVAHRVMVAINEGILLERHVVPVRKKPFSVGRSDAGSKRCARFQQRKTLIYDAANGNDQHERRQEYPRMDQRFARRLRECTAQFESEHSQHPLSSICCGRGGAGPRSARGRAFARTRARIGNR